MATTKSSRIKHEIERLVDLIEKDGPGAPNQVWENGDHFLGPDEAEIKLRSMKVKTPSPGSDIHAFLKEPTIVCVDEKRNIAIWTLQISSTEDLQRMGSLASAAMMLIPSFVLRASKAISHFALDMRRIPYYIADALLGFSRAREYPSSDVESWVQARFIEELQQSSADASQEKMHCDTVEEAIQYLKNAPLATQVKGALTFPCTLRNKSVSSAKLEMNKRIWEFLDHGLNAQGGQSLSAFVKDLKLTTKRMRETYAAQETVDRETMKTELGLTEHLLELDALKEKFCNAARDAKMPPQKQIEFIFTHGFAGRSSEFELVETSENTLLQPSIQIRKAPGFVVKINSDMNLYKIRRILVRCAWSVSVAFTILREAFNIIKNLFISSTPGGHSFEGFLLKSDLQHFSARAMNSGAVDASTIVERIEAMQPLNEDQYAFFKLQNFHVKSEIDCKLKETLSEALERLSKPSMIKENAMQYLKNTIQNENYIAIWKNHKIDPARWTIWLQSARDVVSLSMKEWNECSNEPLEPILKVSVVLRTVVRAASASMLILSDLVFRAIISAISPAIAAGAILSINTFGLFQDAMLWDSLSEVRTDAFVPIPMRILRPVVFSLFYRISQVASAIGSILYCFAVSIRLTLLRIARLWYARLVARAYLWKPAPPRRNSFLFSLHLTSYSGIPFTSTINVLPSLPETVVSNRIVCQILQALYQIELKKTRKTIQSELMENVTSVINNLSDSHPNFVFSSVSICEETHPLAKRQKNNEHALQLSSRLLDPIRLPREYFASKTPLVDVVAAVEKKLATLRLDDIEIPQSLVDQARIDTGIVFIDRDTIGDKKGVLDYATLQEEFTGVDIADRIFVANPKSYHILSNTLTEEIRRFLFDIVHDMSSENDFR